MSAKFFLLLWIFCAILEIGSAKRRRSKTRSRNNDESDNDESDYDDSATGSTIDNDTLMISSIVTGAVIVIIIVVACSLYWGYCNAEQKKKCRQVGSCCWKLIKMGDDDDE
ncbi:uncharacterized protein LOC125675110 [Ostrea edulis]|uniref:uncharacterized protein LOC125675110 n=1 Tax=Ostrea edulis TaxID=37623 RepID=UPI002095E285|nr:uncharacterized protein LOC125675110 [Ostrea edulis]